MTATNATYHDIHGLITVNIIGSDEPVGKVLDATLRSFAASEESADLSVILGEFPGNDWEPGGYTVGDRLLYDFETDSTTVFRRPTSATLQKSDVEYIIVGDIRTGKTKVTVYVPHLSKKLGHLSTITRGLARRSAARTVLATFGGRALQNEDVELDAARIRLAILEPFLYYRLPFRGASLAHGSVVSLDESGLMFAGSGHIGKTALSLEMVKRGYSYLGDDLVMINDSGEALPYPEPIRIQEQHLTIFPGLSRRLMSEMGPVQRFLFSRLVKTSPGEVLNLMPRLAISDVIEGARTGGTCRLDTVVVIRKGVTDDPILKEINTETASKALAAELFWEFEAGHWRHNQYTFCPCCAKGNDFLLKKQNTIS